MSDRELLALILGSGVRGANVKQVAAMLLRKFGEDSLTAYDAAQDTRDYPNCEQ
jgi:DNA repair protein RadC